MIDLDIVKTAIVQGLKDSLQVPVIRANQNTEPPSYPYISYTITTLQSENKGTWGMSADEIDRKPVTQTWSISVQSNNYNECAALTLSAKDWLDHTGHQYIKDMGVVVLSVGNITNRDNILTTDYEYKHGFDVVLGLISESQEPYNETSYIETVILNKKE